MLWAVCWPAGCGAIARARFTCSLLVPLQTASSLNRLFWGLRSSPHRHCSIVRRHSRPGLAANRADNLQCSRTRICCAAYTALSNSPHCSSCHYLHHCTTKRATRSTCSAQASHHTCTARSCERDGGTRRERRPLPTQTARSRKPKIDLCRLCRM